MSGYRSDQAGISIDRAKPLSFTWEGRALTGFAGDTLASALIANGVEIVGRSFKLHRPRGIMASGTDEANAIVQLERGPHAIPNEKATRIELYDGLVASPVNCWPSAKWDAMALTGLASRFLPAGFYYKTFIQPDWHLFEPSIRKAAGLGVAPGGPDPDIYDHKFAHCDLLIVGAGPAGLAAALSAAKSGAKIMLVEQDPQLGGSLIGSGERIDGSPAAEWIADAHADLRASDNVQILTRAMAFGYYDDDLVGLIERRTDHLPLTERRGPRQRLWKVRARRVLTACGAFERPLVFPDNDRPGVMLANAGVTYAARYGAIAGQRIVLAGNNSGIYAQANALIGAGVSVSAIADSRAQISDHERSFAAGHGIELLEGMAPVRAQGRVLRSVTFGSLDDSGIVASKAGLRKITCDCLLTSSGWSPAVHLFSQAGGRLRFDEEIQAFVPREPVQNVQTIGSANGVFSTSLALEQGEQAGRAAISGLGQRQPMPAPKSLKTSTADYAIQPLWRVGTSALGSGQGKAWVDLQNDVAASDIDLALQENYRSVEHVKRYTTLGMASDQGKTSNVNAIGIMHTTLDKPLADVGTTKFRPPFDPVTIGAFAGLATGDQLQPRRIVPSDASARAAGAVFEEYGPWQRPAWFAREGEDEHSAIHREVLAVRKTAGVFDASPLGKIEVAGPDATEFLNRFYIGNIATLKVGRCRYGLMLDENGVVLDDGVLARMADDHYLVGTTSGQAKAVAAMLDEWHQCEWPHLDVAIADVTTCWAVMALVGPAARDILASFESDFDFSREVLPFMRFVSGTFEGVPCRIQRVSFTGELSYEISVPWGYGASLWGALLSSDGGKGEIVPFGVEALMVMRVEKGFLHLGSETDGMTLPQDLGFGPMIDRKPSDFVGRRSTARSDGLRGDRRQMVGLESDPSQPPLVIGSHVTAGGTAGAASQGWVTSSVHSPTLNRPMALAMIERGRERMGETISIYDLGKVRTAKIVEPGGYDPKGERQNV